MAEQPDLTLPERIPEMAQYHDKPMDLLPFAFYTLCEIDDEKLEAYRLICTTDTQDKNVKFPPQYKFVDEPLQSVVDHHLELGKEGEFDAQYFAVCVYADSWTVVIVTLDDEDLQCEPDLMWMGMDQVGSALVNMQIANIDFHEFKEESAGGPQFRPPSTKKIE